MSSAGGLQARWAAVSNFEPGDPAVGARVKPGHVDIDDLLDLDDAGGLFESELEIVVADLGQITRRPEPPERKRRLFPAHDDQVHPLRHEGDEIGEAVAPLLRREHLNVVECEERVALYRHAAELIEAELTEMAECDLDAVPERGRGVVVGGESDPCSIALVDRGHPVRDESGLTATRSSTHNGESRAHRRVQTRRRGGGEKRTKRAAGGRRTSTLDVPTTPA